MTTLPPAELMTVARHAQVAWAARSVPYRTAALRRLRHAIARHMDAIIALLSAEVGKPPLDAMAGDVMVTLEQMRYYERRAPRILAPRRVGKPPLFFAGARFSESSEPYGVALVIAPWNYPLQLALVPAITALTAGNAVVLKCSERTPRTAEMIDSLAHEARLPEGLLQVSCEQPEAVAALIDARPDLIFFTGSSSNGRVVAEHAASLLIPTLLELGGKDPCLVFADCDLPRAIEGVTYSAFSNAGQVCVGAKRIYVEQPIYESFFRGFLARARQLRVGEEKDADLGPIRFAPVRQLLYEQVEDAVGRGATLHTKWAGESESVPPLILTDVPADARLLTEESFGPVVCVAPFAGEAEAVALANATPFALSASVFCRNTRRGARIAAHLSAGSCVINDAIRNIGNPQAAFGGNGASGYGRYHGAAGLLAFSRVKSIMTVRHPRRREIHWFPFTARTYALIRGLLLWRHRGGFWLRRGGGPRQLAFFLFASLFAAAAAPAQSAPAPLTLDIQLPPDATGSLAYLIFTSRDGFPDTRDKALRHAFVPLQAAGGREQRIDAGPLPPGRYAVTVYLDSNGNHKLDRNFLGIPNEPVGASNNPRSRMGPPHFDDCAFQHGSSSQTIQIRLVH